MVVIDIVPYQWIQSLRYQEPKEFGWIWPRIKLLHLEMSMLSAMVGVLWHMTRQFAAVCYGWTTAVQQKTLYKYVDHHKA